MCHVAGISGQYPLVQNMTVTEGGTANLTCRVEYNDNTSLQWSNPAQQTLFFGDKKGELQTDWQTAAAAADAVLQNIPCVGFVAPEKCHKTHKNRIFLFFLFSRLESNLDTLCVSPSVCHLNKLLSVLWHSICPTLHMSAVFLSPSSFHLEKETHFKSFPPGIECVWLLLVFFFSFLNSIPRQEATLLGNTCWCWWLFFFLTCLCLSVTCQKQFEGFDNLPFFCLWLCSPYNFSVKTGYRVYLMVGKPNNE